MDLFIMRHGKAENARHGHNDTERELTKKGREDIVAVGEWMIVQGLQFDLIAASPLTRAQETAAIVADILNERDDLITWNALVPDGNPDKVCREIGRHTDAGAILLVGHEPLLSSLISRIIGGEVGAGIVMTKGALAKIRNFSFVKRPSGELDWLITAKQMTGIR